MELNRTIGLICSYYLSRFDDRAYDRLGFQTQQQTHEALADVLRVKPSTVKNWRDEFDPIHENDRVGWNMRPMAPSRVATVETLSSLSFEKISLVVERVLESGPGHSRVRRIAHAIEFSTSEEQGEPAYVPRGPTGTNAEEFFCEYHAREERPFPGELTDMTDMGCGYDYKLAGEDREIAVEVKGLAGEEGGISFTSKEWDVANEMAENYLVAIIRSVDSDSPEISWIWNPTEKCTPRESEIMQIQVRYNLTTADLRGVTAEEPLVSADE